MTSSQDPTKDHRVILEIPLSGPDRIPAKIRDGFYGALYRAIGIDYHRQEQGAEWSFGLAGKSDRGDLVGGEYRMLIGSANREFTKAVLEAAQASFQTPVGPLTLHPDRSVRPIPVRPAAGVVVQTVTPIFVPAGRGADHQALGPDHPDFVPSLVRILRWRLETIAPHLSDRPFSLQWLLTSQAVTFRIHAGGVLAFHGALLMTGDPEIVTLARLVGMGGKTGIGMGCVAAKTTLVGIPVGHQSTQPAEMALSSGER